MDPNKRFSLDQINKLKRSAPQGMASVDKKPRVAYTSTQGVSSVHPQGPHIAPRRPPTLEPKRFTNSLFNIPVQNTASQIHTQSNNTASMPLLVRPYADNKHVQLQPGDILFVKKNTAGRYLSEVQNIFMLNNHLQTKSKSDTTTYKFAGPAGLEEVNQWSFFGIYRNESNVTNAPMPATYHPPSQDKNHQSLVNVDVFGRSRILNIFGDPTKHKTRPSPGDLLGLRLYRNTSTVNGTMIFLPTINGKPAYAKTNDGHKSQYLDIPLGIVTFVSGTSSGRYPTFDELTTYDKNKKMSNMEILIV